MRVCLLNCRVLSSSALIIVGPLIAALDAATMTKSFPVMPSSASLDRCQQHTRGRDDGRHTCLQICRIGSKRNDDRKAKNGGEVNRESTAARRARRLELAGC